MLLASLALSWIVLVLMLFLLALLLSNLSVVCVVVVIDRGGGGDVVSFLPILLLQKWMMRVLKSRLWSRCCNSCCWILLLTNWPTVAQSLLSWLSTLILLCCSYPYVCELILCLTWWSFISFLLLLTTLLVVELVSVLKWLWLLLICWCCWYVIVVVDTIVIA